MRLRAPPLCSAILPCGICRVSPLLVPNRPFDVTDTKLKASQPRHAALLALIWIFVSGCVPTPPSPTPTPSPSSTPTATVMFPTLVPTSTEIPPNTPAPPPDPLDGAGEMLYQSDFEDAEGWPLGRDALGATSLLQGSLSFVVSRPSVTRVAVSPAPAAHDFVLQAHFSPLVCDGQDEYGLIFRQAPQGLHLRFTVTCSGGVRARRVDDDGPRALVPFIDHHPAVASGAPGQNQLSVRALGEEIRLYVNGVQVLQVSDSSPLSGHSGLVVTSDRSGQTTLMIDEFALFDLTPAPADSRETSDG